MTLQVSFDQFAETVKRVLGHHEAYVSPHPVGSLITSAKPDHSSVVAAIAKMDPDIASRTLRDAGMEVFSGTWLTPEEVLAPELVNAQTHIAAVAYRSAGDRPGLWVDAFPSAPTQVMALRSMYDEFRSTGELAEVTFEEFANLANPTVVIVSPIEVERFLKSKEDC